MPDIEVALGDVFEAALDRPPILGHIGLHGHVFDPQPTECQLDRGTTLFEITERC